MGLRTSYRPPIRILFLLFLASCSTEKDTFVHRFYHNTTARYNGYYYADLSVTKGMEKVRKEYKEDYSKILPVFNDGDKESASVAYPEMDRSIKKLSKVVERHSMEIYGKEKCKWIDDSYLLLGRSYYYKRNFSKAEEIFTYVSKEYRRKPIRPHAMIWLARTQTEAGKLDEARNILQLIREERLFQKREREDLKDYYEETFAQLHIEQGNYKKAASMLEEAIDRKRWLLDRDRKERLRFILGQLYHKIGNVEEGNQNFAKVVSYSPPYEMAFQAKIKQALSYRQGVKNSSGIKQQLLKMLDDEKNRDYRDQIYFALAEVEIAEGDQEGGVRYLKKSVEAENVSKPKQRTEAHLKLADIHFKKPDYEKAQKHYKKAYERAGSGHDRYLEIERRANSLSELVKKLNTIEKQDSLLRMAKMDKGERRKKIEDMIEKRVEQAQNEKQEQQVSEDDLREQNAFASGSNNGGSTFYFYNQKAKSKGYNNFQRIWGERPLRDDWRRSKTARSQPQKFEDPAADSLESEAGVVTDPSFYEKDLPIKEEEKRKTKKRIAQAMYDAAITYREDLDNEDQAKKMFRELVKRFELKAYSPPAYYQLYRIFLNKERRSNYFSTDQKNSSGHYKDIILERYPDSDYAELIRDPDGLEKEQKARKKAKDRYERTLLNYQEGRFDSVIARSDKALSNGTGDALKAKYRLLKGLSLGRSDSMMAAKKVLNQVIEKHGEQAEAERAKAILKRLKKKGSSSSDQDLKVKETPFKKRSESEHYFCIVVPKGAGDAGKVKTGVSDFNQQYFSNRSLNITSTFLRNKDNLILVKKFKKKKGGMDYYRTFLQRSSVLDILDMKKCDIFIIAQENFGTMFREQKSEEYMPFFRQVYLNN